MSPTKFHFALTPNGPLALYIPPFVINAQAIRAVRLASATVISMGCFLPNIRLSQDPSGAPWRAAHRTTDAAPMINNRRKSRWPILDVLPSFVLPPVEFCLGVSPNHAEKSRPFVKLAEGGANASRAVAMTGPIPGMVIRRFAISSSLARCAISASSCLILVFNCPNISTRGAQVALASSGRSHAGSSSLAIKLPTWAGPAGM